MEEKLTIFCILKTKGNQYFLMEKGSYEYNLQKKAGAEELTQGSRSMCEAFRTPGQAFKEKHNYSRTMSRLIRRIHHREGIAISVEDYKAMRRRRKKAQWAEHLKKRDRTRAIRVERSSRKKGVTGKK